MDHFTSGPRVGVKRTRNYILCLGPFLLRLSRLDILLFTVETPSSHVPEVRLPVNEELRTHDQCHPIAISPDTIDWRNGWVEVTYTHPFMKWSHSTESSFASYVLRCPVLALLLFLLPYQ